MSASQPDPAQTGAQAEAEAGAGAGAEPDFSREMDYGDYLQLDTLLSCNHPRLLCKAIG